MTLRSQPYSKYRYFCANLEERQEVMSRKDDVSQGKCKVNSMKALR